MQATYIWSSKISTELVRYNFKHRMFKNFLNSDSFRTVCKGASVEHNVVNNICAAETKTC